MQPILRNLAPDSAMTKALLLGIALSSNIGGAASPIASPQNLIALQNMSPQPSWGVWFFVALPVCIISLLLIWLLLLATFQPGRNTTIVPIRPMKDRFTGMQWFISGVTVATILLWCVSHQIEGVVGDMGVVAIIPIVLFFGTGVLTKEDFNNFLWTIIILAAGGLALGKAVNSSGLLHTIAAAITQRVDGLSLYAVLLVFTGLILVVATFISHTVAALIVLPLVQTVGQGMAEPHPNLLVMGSVLMCSAAMGLPTSGFPNMSESPFRFLPLRPGFPSMRGSADGGCSGDHDGGSADRAALLAGQALHHQGRARVGHGVARGHQRRVWVDACCGHVSGLRPFRRTMVLRHSGSCKRIYVFQRTPVYAEIVLCGAFAMVGVHTSLHEWACDLSERGLHSRRTRRRAPPCKAGPRPRAQTRLAPSAPALC